MSAIKTTEIRYLQLLRSDQTDYGMYSKIERWTDWCDEVPKNWWTSYKCWKLLLASCSLAWILRWTCSWGLDADVCRWFVHYGIHYTNLCYRGVIVAFWIPLGRLLQMPSHEATVMTSSRPHHDSSKATMLVSQESWNNVVVCLDYYTL